MNRKVIYSLWYIDFDETDECYKIAFIGTKGAIRLPTTNDNQYHPNPIPFIHKVTVVTVVIAVIAAVAVAAIVTVTVTVTVTILDS